MSLETDASEHARDGLTEAAIRTQLQTILASSVFARAQQLRRFLAFIVEQELAGQGGSLKESVLAHEVYGKGTDFDGGADPVVRVDARRVRDKLREYYEGRTDPIVISLPKGSYVPVFEANPASRPTVASSIGAPEAQQPLPVSNVSRARIAIGALAIAAVATVAVVAWRVRTVPAATPARLLPLASYPGVEEEPALSPDGNLVAFAWSGAAGTGATDIYVKAVGSEALRPLTATPVSETSPAWSPDGHSIAFVRDGQGVYTMSQLGGDERRVSPSGTHVAWAGDSKSVLIRDRERNTSPFGIYQVFLDTLDRRQLTQAPVGAGDWRFEVSPDGRTLAFIRYEKVGIADVHVVSMGGGEPRRLTSWNAAIDGVSWTPDGREIVYSVDVPPASRLWRIRADGDTPAQGTPIADIPVAAMNPSISRPMPGRAARLAFQTITRDIDLQLTDLGAPPVNGRLESRPVLNSTRVEGSARFSPDGNRVAFTSFRSGFPEVWVAEREGNGLRQLTTMAASGVLIGEWSPDGTRIAFEAAVDGNTDVYLVGADGGHLRRLTDEASMEGVPSWSRDGQWVYFVSTRAGAIPDVWRISPDGGEPLRVTHNGGFEPREAPDGDSLYYLDRHPGGAPTDARLMRAPVGGGQPELVLEHVRPFLWSVTDTGIVFVTREPDVDAIDLYRFSDRRVTRLGGLTFQVPGRYTHMTASRDGRWMLATKMERFDSDLMRLDDFR
jgi:Tol biopolymer transport system component